MTVRLVMSFDTLRAIQKDAHQQQGELMTHSGHTRHCRNSAREADSQPQLIPMSTGFALTERSQEVQSPFDSTRGLR